MKLQIGYKVVRAAFGVLHSAVACDYRGYNVEYKVGELVKPQVAGTKLMAFARFQEAKSYVNLSWNDKMEIYEAILVNPEPLARVMALEFLATQSKQFISNNWAELFNSTPKNVPWGHCRLSPSGTLGCEQIQLVRRVYS